MASFVKASHLLVKTEDEALKLKKDIENGLDFAKAAQKVSLCPSGKNGGDPGYFTRGQMVKEFEEAAFAMNVGEVSSPIKTQFGYHLIYLTDKKD